MRCTVMENGAYLGVCEHLRRKQGEKRVNQNDFLLSLQQQNRYDYGKFLGFGKGSLLGTCL